MMITHQRTIFISHVLHETVFCITLRHGTAKQVQTVVVLERTLATKQITGNVLTRISQTWHKYLPLAFLHHNTTYHTSFGCKQSQTYNGLVRDNRLDNKLGVTFHPNPNLNTDFTDELLRRNQIFYKKTKKIKQSNIQYLKFIEKKNKNVTNA